MNQTELLFDRPEAAAVATLPPPQEAPPALPPWTNTRRQAFDRIGPVAGRIASQVFATIYTAGDEGRTDEEVAAALGMRESTTRARRVELRDAGLVIDSGRRRRTTSGRAAAVWVVGEVGTPGPAAIGAAGPGTVADNEPLPF